MKNSIFQKGADLHGEDSSLSISLSRLAQSKQTQEESESITEETLFASMEDDALLASVSDKAAQDERSLAASLVLEWVTTETNSFDELEALVAGTIVGADDSDDEDVEIDPDKLSDEDSEDFNGLFNVVGQALTLLSGLPAKTIQKFIDEEDDEVAADIIKAITEKAKGESSDEIVADFSVRQSMLLSAKVKVVRNGEVKYINKKVRKRKMTSAQRQALKKARKKSNNSASRAKRKKSNRLRARSGM